MKKIFLIITISLFAVSAFAQIKQEQNRHEFSIWATGGISTLHSNLANGHNDLFKDMSGLDGAAGLGYNYFFTYNWSLGTGLEFAVMRATIHLEEVQDSYLSPDGTGNYWIINTAAQEMKENQVAYFLNVPLMAKYQTDICKKGHKFYVAFGPKLGIPFSAAKEPEYTTEGTLKTVAYSADANGQKDSPDPVGTQAPFGTVTFEGENQPKGTLDLGLSFIGSVETGVKWRFNDALSLYTGLFLDYGFNNIHKETQGEQANRFYDYDEVNGKFNINSVMCSQYNDEEFTSRVNTFSTGIKVQFTFGIKPFAKKVKEAGKQQEQQIIVVKEDPKPYEGLTEEQMKKLMDDNNKKNQEMIDAQNKEIREIKDLLKKEDPELGESIYGFDLDDSKLLDQMYAELDRKVALMKKYPNTKVILEGHTDEQGTANYNYDLGLKRARAAKDYMVSKGIDESRLSVSSKGKSEPKVTGKDSDSRRMNRRVEFLFR